MDGNNEVFSGIAGIASALINAGGSLGGVGLSYGQQKKLMQHQAKTNYEYSEKYGRNLPTWNRAGLETAGYNPMLAVQNSTNGSNATWTSAQSANAPDLSNAITQGISNAQSYQRLENETKTAHTQSKANEATAENQASQALNNLEENKFISGRRKAEIANVQSDTALKEAQIDNMEKQIELGHMGISVQQEANAIQAKGNPFRAARDLAEKYGYSPKKFGAAAGRRFIRDNFPRLYKAR